MSLTLVLNHKDIRTAQVDAAGPLLCGDSLVRVREDVASLELFHITRQSHRLVVLTSLLELQQREEGLKGLYSLL